MIEAIKKTQTPEEQELEAKLRQLDQLEDELLTKETELETLRLELQALEKKYLDSVGRKFLELDKLEQRIADLLIKPKEESVFEDVPESEPYSRAKFEEQEKKEDYHIPDDLKRLYRELCKKVHPDLTTDPAEKKIREKFMAEVNTAYREKNRSRLLELLQQWLDRPESIKEDDIGSRLVRAIRQIAMIKKKIAVIEAEAIELKQSQLYKLKVQFEEYAKKGQSLFAEMIEKINVDIDKAREKLKSLLYSQSMD